MAAALPARMGGSAIIARLPCESVRPPPAAAVGAGKVVTAPAA